MREYQEVAEPSIAKPLYRGKSYTCEVNGCSKKWKTVCVWDVIPPICIGCGNPGTEYDYPKISYWELSPIELIVDFERHYDESFRYGGQEK